MKTFEELVKNRLEGCESGLPEEDLAEFRSKLDKAHAVPENRKAAYAAWLVPLAAAAGLALFLMPGNDRTPELALEKDSSAPIAEVLEHSDNHIAEQTGTGTAVKAPEGIPASPGKTAGPATAETAVVEETSAPEESPAAPEETAAISGEASVTPAQIDTPNPESPSGPNAPSTGYKPVSIKVGKASAAVIGTAGTAALAVILPSLSEHDKQAYADDPLPPPGEYLDWGADSDAPTPPPTPKDERTGDDTHHLPLRAGFSLLIPLNDRWSLTTGLGYSLYSSTIGYTHSSDKQQDVHYLDLPVRADYTLARNRWLEVYLGAGASADFCVAAKLAGARTERDGVGVSLVGAGGMQFNITDRIGLFVDPSLSWDLLHGCRTLDTYRSEHPLMFSVTGGIRLTLKK